MTNVQFAALARLLRLRAGPAQDAARLVLVDGASQADAARATGLTQQAVHNAVRRAQTGLALTLFAAGCATQQPPAPSCPPPPQLPALQALPPEVTEPPFLSRLETILFPKPSEPTSYELRSPPAQGNTTLQGLR